MNNLLESIQENMTYFSESIAIECCHGTYTYNELSNMLVHVAKFLESTELESENILVFQDKDYRVVANLLGIWYSGNVFVPAHCGWPLKQLQTMVEKLEVSYVFTEVKYLPLLSELSKRVNKKLHAIIWSDDSEVVIQSNVYEGLIIDIIDMDIPLDISSVKRKYSDIGYIYHTSGSTSDAKEVVGSLYGILRFIEWEKEELSVENGIRVSMITNLTFDAVLRDILLPLLSGGILCIPEQDTIYDANKLAQWIQEKEINVIHMVPSLFRELMTQVQSKDMFPVLKYILLAGEPISGGDVSLFYELFEGRIQIINLYGATETGMVKFFFRITKEHVNLSRIPVGYPICTTEALIIDGDGKFCENGCKGEICIKTDICTYGYYKNDALNAKSFIELDGTKAIYRTGDLGYINEDGCLICLGRADNQVKIRGMKVNLVEIEQVMNKFKGIIMSAVIVKTSKLNEKYLVGYFISEEDIKEELYDYLCNELPDYMVPTFLVRLDSLPRLVNGKLNRNALKQMNDEYECIQVKEPVNETQRKLLFLWKETLQVEYLGVEQDFFRVGGHSLKAYKLVNKINKEFQINMRISDIFKCRTIIQQEKYIQFANVDENQKIEHVSTKEKYEASERQKGIYLASISNEKKTLYNMPCAYKLIGKVNVEKVRQTMQAVFDRHESLRTSLLFENGQIVQKVRTNIEVPFEYEELEEDVNIEQLLHSCIKPFDFEKEPLFRSKLFKKSKDCYILFWDMHHCISDGVSEEIIKSNWENIYNGIELPPVMYQYKDFSYWLKKNVEADNKQTLDYWLSELKDNNFKVDLSYDYLKQKRTTYLGGNVLIDVDEDLYYKMIKFSKIHNTTLYSILLSGLYILLHKYTKQEDITIGTVGAGREQQEFSETVGVFINTFAMRNYPESQKKVFDFVNQVSEKSLEMLGNSNYSFQEMVNLLRQQIGEADSLIEVMFILQNMDASSFQLRDVVSQLLYVQRGIAKYNLTFYVYQREGNLSLDIEYSSELFNRKTVQHLAESYVYILEQICTSVTEDSIIKDIQVYSTNARKQLLDRSNGSVDAIEPVTVHEMFERKAIELPDKIAIRCKDKEMSYSDLNKRANQIAHRLRSDGVKQNDVIGIMVQRNFDMIASILAVLKVGCAYIPIDPTYPEGRILYMLEHSGCQYVLMDEEKFESNITVINVNNTEINSLPDENLNLVVQPNSLAYIIYTSGSTGKPKGVMLEHGNVVNFIKAMCKEVDFSTERRILCLTTISFDIFVLETLLPLTQGMEIIMVCEDEQLDARKVGMLIERYDVNIMQITPSRLEMYLEDKKAYKYFEKVQTFLIGGEAIRESTLKRLEKVSKDLEVYDVYGPTETCVWSTIKKLSFNEPITIGNPIMNTRIYILDNELNLVPDGVYGDLYIGGLGVARGYVKNEELTRERFICNPFIEGERIYNTGDKARWNCDGEIEFLGRNDNQVKVRGYRVELSEIDNCILENNEILHCVSIVKSTEESQGNYILTFYTAENELDKKELLERVKAALPNYMIPKDFICLSAMPMTPNGKIDKRALENMEYKEEKGEIQSIQFANKVEKSIYKIWVNSLGHNNFGLDDNFFTIGGNSMLIVQSFYQIDNLYPDSLTIVDLFANPTVKSIAALIQKKIINQLQPQRMQLREKYFKYCGVYRPFVLGGEFTEQQKKGLYNICKNEQINEEEILFAIYAFLCARITGRKEVYVQCMISQLKGAECRVSLENVQDYKQLLVTATNAYRTELQEYEFSCIRDEEVEYEIYLSYSFNHELTNVNLNMLDMCLSLEEKDEKLSWKIIFNTGKIKKELSEKISEVFMQIVNSLLSC